MASAPPPQLRLRIFAGPNGSGKSTIINAIRQDQQNGRPIDLGVYINADDIVRQISAKEFSFASFGINVNKERLIDFVIPTGLLNDKFTLEDFKRSFHIRSNKLFIKENNQIDRVGQIVARFLRDEMLRLRKRFSFETVFSHESTIDLMQEAVALGYKVYLYFVSTESPAINKYRVQVRVKNGGHDVPPDKIESRYYRSLELVYRASQYCHQAFFFDNSHDAFTLIGHFKKKGKRKDWDVRPPKNVGAWFKKYYKAPSKKKP